MTGKKKNKLKNKFELLPINLFDNNETRFKYSKIDSQQLQQSINNIKTEFQKNNYNFENENEIINNKKIGVLPIDFLNDCKKVAECNKNDSKQLQSGINDKYNENDYIFLKESEIINFNYDDYDIL